MTDQQRTEEELDITEPETSRNLRLFGRDVSQMPCFRNSFVYGISSGLGVGFATFMGTSRPALAMHCTMAGFTCVTLSYWFTCRYQYSKTKFELAQVQQAMKAQAVLEGTALEQEIINAKTV